MLTEEEKRRGVDTAPGSLRPVSEGVQVNQFPSPLSLDVATPRASGALFLHIQLSSFFASGKRSLLYNATLEIQIKYEGYHSPSGFAHFLFSMRPVFGHRISCQDTGSIVAPRVRDKHTSSMCHIRKPRTCFARCKDYPQVVPARRDIVAACVAQ